STTTGVLSLSGTDTAANYQQVLRTVSYNNSSISPTTTSRVVTVRASDGALLSATATATVTVVAVNTPPVAAGDTATTAGDTSTPVAVLANDSDPDGALNPASVSVTAAPAHGATGVNTATGAVSYTPTLNFNGSDVFTYQVCDNGVPAPVRCASANVTVTVTA